MKNNAVGITGASLTIIGAVLNIIIGLVFILLALNLSDALRNDVDYDLQNVGAIIFILIFEIILLLIGLIIIALSIFIILGAIKFIKTGKHKVLVGIVSLVLLMVTIVGFIGGILILVSKQEES